MKFLVLAVFLAVIQAPPPTPRQAADDQAGQASKHHRETDAKPKSAIPPSVPVNTSDHAPQRDGQPNPDRPSNTEETIRVPELPPVTVSTDAWTKFYVVFTGALVLVGVLGACLALRTLRAIERQVNLMAGGLYVDGARVIEFAEGRKPVCFVKIANSGPIPAIVSVAMNVELANSITDYPRDPTITIPAHGSYECPIRCDRKLEIGDVLKVERGDIPLRVFGRVTSRKGQKEEIVEYCYLNYAQNPA